MWACREHRRTVSLGGLTVLAVLLLTAPAAAQKDYYNTDRNRPVRIEDAYATERYALEVKVAPLRLERSGTGLYSWGFDPEIAYGILPRTSIELGFPLVFIDGGESGWTSGLAGIELSAFHNLNVESRTLPALAVRAHVVLPAGNLAADRAYPSLTGIATRTFTWARFHVNGMYTLGSVPGEEEGAAGASLHGESRWLAGIAVDRAFPLQSALLIADVFASQPLHADDPLEWSVGGGVRYQLTPYLALDAGLGRRLTGNTAWYVTFGSAYHIGIRSLMPRHF